MNLSQTSYTESFYSTLAQPRVYPRGSWSLSYLLIMENNQKDSNFQSYLLNLNIRLLNCVVPSQSKHWGLFQGESHQPNSVTLYVGRGFRSVQ